MRAFIAAIALAAGATPALTWNVARTPPMGFNTWNLYHCSVNASILTDTAAAMVKFGLKDAGYVYVNSDDCWMSFERDASGNQVPDPTKFPDGFKAVADQIHSLGMMSGLYTAKGPHTCQKRAASCLHEMQDAKQWASWGIDYVKDDSCSTCNMPNGTAFTDMEDYHRMWQGIQDSGHPMVLTVEGSPPADIITHGGYGNAKRVGHDIGPSWGSMISLVDIGSGLWPYAHGTLNETFGGWWNDLDMIEIGNGGPPAPSPGPSPPPPPPPPGTKVLYPWAVPPSSAGAGWAMSPGGTVTNGGMCLTAGSTVSMEQCDASKGSTQQWKLEQNGNLHPVSQPTSCAALLGGNGPALTMAACKTGARGANEEFTLSNGQLCSTTLGNSKPVCLKVEADKPGNGGGGDNDGFNCVANPEALARCRVHFTMWTIMKAPLLLGNDIPKMDSTALGVVTNKDAIAISQDDLGVQAQRVWTSPGKAGGALDARASAIAVAARCDPSRSTQAWRVTREGALATTDAAGVDWCVHDVDGTEEVGSWRTRPCTGAHTGTALKHLALGDAGGASTRTALVTPSGARLVWNNAHGASGPAAHTRYLAVDRDAAASSHWLREPAGPAGGADGAFRLVAADRSGIRDDDKVGGVTLGGDFCLDVAQDGDKEVWAGPLSGKRWAVALLNRDALSNATVEVAYTMFNASSTASFDIRDVWQGADFGTHVGSYSASVPPQAVTYLVLTPSSSSAATEEE